LAVLGLLGQGGKRRKKRIRRGPSRAGKDTGKDPKVSPQRHLDQSCKFMERGESGKKKGASKVIGKNRWHMEERARGSIGEKPGKWIPGQDPLKRTSWDVMQGGMKMKGGKLETFQRIKRTISGGVEKEGSKGEERWLSPVKARLSSREYWEREGGGPGGTRISRIWEEHRGMGHGSSRRLKIFNGGKGPADDKGRGNERGGSRKAGTITAKENARGNTIAEPGTRQ